MKVKTLIISTILSIAFMLAGSASAMNMNALTYEDLLTLYFGVLAPEWDQNAKAELKYTNIDQSSKLYSLLSTAVANNKFPNLSIPLPLNKSAYESDLADLIKNNYNKKIVYTDKKVLTFEFLQTELKKVYNTKATPTKTTTNTNNKVDDSVAESVLFLLKENYINKDQLSGMNKIDSENLSDFIDALGEEYTVYYSPEDGKKFMDSLNSEFAGIGVYLVQKDNENPIISEVIKDSPADKAGLLAEDIINAIDGKYLKDFENADKFIDALKGEKGTSVTVQIQRNGRILNINVNRDVIHLPTIDSVNLGEVCYVRLYSFDIGMYDKFMSEIDKLGSCGKYIFDIRSNPGGVIEEVVGILDEFIPEGKVIMTEKGTSTNEILYSKKTPSITVSDPMIVLVDGYTASASEIFAGVLKYYYPDKVKLVGSKTYGKGSVQQVVQFPNNSIIKYTIAIRYIADQDVSIDKVGIQPDINVIDNPYTKKDEVLEVIGISNT